MVINLDPFQKREAQNYDNPIASREHLLTIINNAPLPLNFKALCQKLGYQNDELKAALKARLRAMERDGQLIFNKFQQYQIPTAQHLLTGKVIGHQDGYGFFESDAGGKDLFISASEMQRVFHGDVITAIVNNRTDRKGRKEIKVVEVIEPRKAPIVGRYFRQGNRGFVIPEDKRIQQQILIENADNLGARLGQIVVVEITRRPSKQQSAKGKIVEILGEHLAPGMEIEIALRQHDLPHQWPEAVTEELAKWPDEVTQEMMQGRKDLRDLPLITIDGEDARDFDDAVYCEQKKSGGWRLWVAIADVSYYVRPNTALDNEALSRGNSVYFPSQVIPMLPEKLSNGLCSLNPDVDRLCFVCEMTISEKGNLSGSQFYSAVMRSKARMTYTKVGNMLAGDADLIAQHQAIWPHIQQLHALYQALLNARRERGAIEFETIETKFVFNDHRKIERIEPVTRNDAHKIIEECMILANVATAKFVEKHQLAALFRVHDKPNAEKYQNFAQYLRELGIEAPVHDEVEASDYGAVLEQIENRPDKELIQTLLLRSMRQAVYQSDNIGHFGLSLKAYSHFTSPIRRYPDLIVHRAIKAKLQQLAASDANIGFWQYTPEAMIELGEHCSMTERRADDATRDVADWLKCEYMQDHLGDEFDGIISTVTNFGFFVRLTDIHTEGLVHISSLGQDFFQFDEAHLCLVGEATRIKYHVGDTVKVTVAAVNLDEKKIDLLLVDTVKANKSARKAKNSKKSGFSKSKKKASRTAKSTPVDNKAKKANKKSKRKSRPGKNARKRAK